MSVIARPAATPLSTARRLAADPGRWRPAVDFDPARRYYRRLLADEDHEAWLLTWLPGQHTEWHDHGESAGAFVVLQGVLVERTARHGLVRPMRHVLRPGDAQGFGGRYVHHVGNEGPDPAVSLHVYAPRLATMTEYRDDDGVLAPLHTRTTEDW